MTIIFRIECTVNWKSATIAIRAGYVWDRGHVRRLTAKKWQMEGVTIDWLGEGSLR